MAYRLLVLATVLSLGWGGISVVAAQPTEPTAPPGSDPPEGPAAAEEQSAATSSGSDAATSPADGLTAADVAGAPRPGEVSGHAQPAAESSALLWIPRVVLFVPRLAVEVVSAPVRGGLWVYERYALRDRAKAIFFNEEGTLGIYPVALFETGFGLNVGGRLVARDLFDEEEELKLRASYGGRFSQLYSAKLESGERIPAADLVLEAELEMRPKDNFFGIGNADEVGSAMTVDPYQRDTSTLSRFRQTVGRVSLTGRGTIAGPLYLQASGAYLHRRFDESDEDVATALISDHFDTGAITGWDTGSDQLYSELEIGLDARTHARFEPAPVYSGGWLASAFIGQSLGLVNRKQSFAHYGLDLQRFFKLAAGPRVIALRAYAESVIGSDDEVSFADLPALGGALMLRGYDIDRFRDRALVLTSGEYLFDLGPNFATVLFVDAGRVYRSLKNVSTEDVRVGYGGALQLHTRNSFLARLSIASSIDGGLFFNLSFDPVYDPNARVERK